MLSVNSTPILLNGEPTGPIEKGMTYIVRPFIEPGENLAGPAIAFLGRHPIVRRPGVFAELAANVGQVLGPGHVVRGGAMVEAAGILLLIQQDQLAGGDGLLRETLSFLFRAVDPNDLVGPAHASHFIDPFLQFAVLVHVTNEASSSVILNARSKLSDK